jgi:hypothetical protein
MASHEGLILIKTSANDSSKRALMCIALFNSTIDATSLNFGFNFSDEICYRALAPSFVQRN